jgi:hypothetical protein
MAGLWPALHAKPPLKTGPVAIVAPATEATRNSPDARYSSELDDRTAQELGRRAILGVEKGTPASAPYGLWCAADASVIAQTKIDVSREKPERLML